MPRYRKVGKKTHNPNPNGRRGKDGGDKDKNNNVAASSSDSSDDEDGIEEEEEVKVCVYIIRSRVINYIFFVQH